MKADFRLSVVKMLVNTYSIACAFSSVSQNQHFINSSTDNGWVFGWLWVVLTRASCRSRKEKEAASTEKSCVSAGSSYYGLARVAGLEPATISLAAFMRRILCSFLKGASLPANSHFILPKTRRQKFFQTYKLIFFVFGEAENRRHTAVCQGLRRCEIKK